MLKQFVKKFVMPFSFITATLLNLKQATGKLDKIQNPKSKIQNRFKACASYKSTQHKWVVFALLIAFSVAAIVSISPASYSQTNFKSEALTQTNELRGVWLTNIDSNVLFNRDRLATGIQRLHQLNFNTLYPTVWNWGYTLYPSRVAKRVIGRSLDPTPGLKKRDILKEIVQHGHKTGMGVIPWFEFGFMTPADSALAIRHPNWLTTRRDGSKIWQEGKHKRVWLNPFHPEVQQFIQDLIVEIVSDYDVDGIQFDDHFGLPAELGYDSFTVKLYQQEHQGKLPSNNPQDPEWLRWRADKITQFIRQVFHAVKAEKQSCLISVAPNPQRISYDLFLADWETWERLGLIEELVLQVYRNDLKVFISELNYPEVQAARLHIPVSIGILSGLKDSNAPIRQIQNQVQAVRKRGFAGVSFFFYETLWNLSQEKPAKRVSAFQKIFPTQAKRPSVIAGWKPSSYL